MSLNVSILNRIHQKKGKQTWRINNSDDISSMQAVYQCALCNDFPQILTCGIESALHNLLPVLVNCVSGYLPSLLFQEKL